MRFHQPLSHPWGSGAHGHVPRMEDTQDRGTGIPRVGQAQGEARRLRAGEGSLSAHRLDVTAG